MNLRIACVGLGMSAMTAISGCGQKAAKTADSFMAGEFSKVATEAVNTYKTKAAKAVNNAFKEMSDSSALKYVEVPGLVVQKGDTVLNYYSENAKFKHQVGNRVFNIVGDMITLNEKSPSGIGSLKLIARDTKLPKGATQVAVAKGDSIDYVF